jgi:hypothetical protein
MIICYYLKKQEKHYLNNLKNYQTVPSFKMTFEQFES